MNQSAKIMAQLGVLAAVAAVLGGYAYFGVFKKDQTEAKQKETNEKLFAAEPVALGVASADAGSAVKTEFTRVTVRSKGEVTVLERAVGGPWAMVSPVKADVDPLVIDALTSQLQQAKFKSTLDENPTEADLEKYGLRSPEFVVEATGQAGATGAPTTVKLEGGIENTFDGTIYMRRNGEKPVYLAEGGVRWSLAKSTFDLRKKEVFAVEEAQVQTIDVKAKNNAYRLERNAADQTWQLVKPFTAQADTNTISGLLGVLKGEKALAFEADGPAAKQALGFDAPAVDATLTLKDGSTVHVVTTRPKVDAGNKGYALREDPRGVVVAEIAGNSVTQLDRNPFDLRDKTIVTFKREQVARARFHQADGSEFVLEKEVLDGSVAEAWRVVKPFAVKAKVFKVTSVIWLLGTLKGTAFAEENPKDLAKYGLDPKDPKSRFIALDDGDGHELGRLSIGKEVPNKVNVFYVRGTRPQIIEIDGARFDELPSHVEDFLEAEFDAGARP